MPALIVVFDALLITARRAQRWHLTEALAGRTLTCAAADPGTPGRVYCGAGDGLWRSDDGGATWTPLGDRLPIRHVTAVAVGGAPGGSGGSAVYVGTEPSHLFRSEDGGLSWTELPALRALPSRGEWSFPPRPHTHHVRWIELDPVVAGRIFVAIEAGALVRTGDAGATWHDRVPGGPFDTHTLATHVAAPGRLYAAAGDGYFESSDGGETWRRDVRGLRHRYLVGVGVARADPDTVFVSAAAGPWTAYDPARGEAVVYGRARGGAWHAAEGIAAGTGVTVAHFAPGTAPGELYAVNNHGAFRTADAGVRWSAIGLPWSAVYRARGVRALVTLETA